MVRFKVRYQMGRLYFLLLCLIFFPFFRGAAQVLPEGQRPTHFYYQEIGLVGRSEPKILLISSHIYRVREEASVNLETILESTFSVGFYDLLDVVEYNERLTIPIEKFGFKGKIHGHEWADYDGFRSIATGPELYRQYDHTTRHLHDVREKVMADYRSRGYRIFQIDTRPYLDLGEHLSIVEFVERLSPLEVEVYREGVIRSILESAVKRIEEKRDDPKPRREKKEKKEISHHEACLYARERVIAAMAEAERRPSTNRWKKAQAEYDNFLAGCATSGVDIPVDWMNQIAAGHAAAFAVEAAKTLYTTFTTVPWTYGYGQFFDAKNKTFYHRFQFGGMGDTYNKRTPVTVSFSLMSNIARLPSYTIYYSFWDHAGNPWNSAHKSEQVENLGFVTGSFGPKLSIWPQRNFFIRMTPEIHLGFNNGSRAPVVGFTAFPGGHGEAGIRIGKVYLSAACGMIWKKFDVNSNISYARKHGVYESAFSGTVQGEWVAESFEDGKMRRHRYWVFSLGLDL